MLKRLISALCVLLPSGPTRILFRLAGHKIGKNCRLPVLSYVFAENLEFGNDVDIRPFVFINIPRCVIGSSSIVSYGTQIIGSKSFSAGDNCFIGPHCIIHCEENVSMGFYSGLGARCIVYSHGSFLPVNRGYPAKFAEIVIEDYVWTAVGVTFLPGAHVESNCIINAGVVVNSRIPSGTLIQQDTRQIQQLDLKKITAFAKRKNDFYHKAVIESFLEDGSHGLSNGHRFESRPDINTIYLYLPGSANPLFYDLENYFCSFSSDKTHKAFLDFLRLRFGISLRTKY